MLILLLILGWKTLWITPFALVAWVGLGATSTVFANGGDTLIRISLFFMLFMKLSERLSLDSFFRTKSGKKQQVKNNVFTSVAHNSALLLCQFQIIFVYAVSSILKLQGAEWLNGTALYYALSLDQFMLYPAFNELLWQISPIIYMFTWVALLTQLLFPVLIPWRISRNVAVVILTGMHLGIAILLGLWPFSLAMIALDFLFIRDGSWSKLRQWCVRGRETLLRSQPDRQANS